MDTDDWRTLMAIAGLIFMLVGAFTNKWNYIIPGMIIWLVYALSSKK